MVVETITEVTSSEEAQDVLAGWRRLGNFAVGYIRQPRTEKQRPAVVGLFTCSRPSLEASLSPGQREVTHLEVRLILPSPE